MPRVKLGRTAPSLTKQTADTIRSAGRRMGYQFDYQLGSIIGVDGPGISRRLSKGSLSHKELVALHKELKFTEDDWRRMGCR
jgi:hypothetical protein